MNQLYKETNEKFIGRVERMVYYICGCDIKRGREILEECLKRNKKKNESIIWSYKTSEEKERGKNMEMDWFSS